jgi:hypothetical protein
MTTCPKARTKLESAKSCRQDSINRGAQDGEIVLIAESQATIAQGNEASLRHEKQTCATQLSRSPKLRWQDQGTISSSILARARFPKRKGDQPRTMTLTCRVPWSIAAPSSPLPAHPLLTCPSAPQPADARKSGHYQEVKSINTCWRKSRPPHSTTFDKRVEIANSLLFYA